MRIILFIMQIILAYGIGVIVPYSLGIGNGLELFVIPLGMGLGIWIPAFFLQKVSWKPLLGATIGAGIFMILVDKVLPPMGFAALLLPVIGAFLGYYAPKFIRSH